MIYTSVPGRFAYGVSIGILCLDTNIALIPGDVGNASTYAYPVYHVRVPGASVAAIVERGDSALAPAFVEAARAMAAVGVRAITSDCGFTALYQSAVRAAVNVPVFLSSLLQVSVILPMLHRDEKLGVMVADETAITPRLLDAVGIRDRSRVVFRGLQDATHFREVVFEESGVLNAARMEAEVVALGQSMLRQDGSIGSFLLECSLLPPYGAALQEATGLPVFDWIGFVNYVHHAVVRTPYRGFA